MENQYHQRMNPAVLRQKAEAVLRAKAARMSEDGTPLSPEEIRKTLHELRVHQIQLEMQNEELRTAQAEIEAGRARYFDLYDLAPVGYCTVSEKGLLVEANLTASVLLGAARSALIQQPISRFIYKDDQDTYYLHRKRLFKTGQPQTCELRMVKPDGALIAVHLATRIVQTPDLGGSALVVLSDMTERQRLERALVEAKERAESANCAKSAFLANMSHELRTPLNAVLGYAQILLQDQAMGAEQQRSVEAIRRGGDYLLLLINDILDLAKIEADRFELFPAPTDPVSVFEQIAEQFVFRARQKGIAFVMQGLEDLPSALEADDKRLRQVVLNLLGNAVKFTEQGEVRLGLAHRAGTLFVSVSDTGIGISKERIACLFTPYTQEGAKEYKRQGTGLGLAICKALVERMGGTIEVSSKAGRGSRFAFSIPAPSVAPKAESKAQDPGFDRVEGYSRTDGEQTPFSILVTDDLESNRLVLAGLLQPLGFAVIQAEGGEAALQTCRRHRPDLVLMDLVMPDLDGLAATRQLCNEHPKMPVIAVSAHAYAQDLENSRAAGCVDHIPKPVRREELLAVLQQHLPLGWHWSPEHRDETAANADETAPEQPPPEALAALKEALLLGSRSRMTAALETLAKTAPRLAKQMQQGIEGYDYDTVTTQIDDLLPQE